MMTMCKIWPGLAAFVLLCLPASLRAQSVRFESTAQTTNAQCSSGSLCPLLAVPGATVQFYTSAALTTPATTYTDATGGTACPVYAQMTLPGSFACSSTTDAAGNIGAWTGNGTFYYTIVFPASAGGGVHGPFAFTSGVSGVVVAGSDTQVQYNCMGAFCASPNFTWNYTTGVLTLKTSGTSNLALDTTTANHVEGITFADAGTLKWGLLKNTFNSFSIYDYSAGQLIFTAASGAGQNINISPTSGTVNFNGNSGSPSIVSLNNAFIQSTGGFLSVANSWQGFNSAVDGILVRGYGLAQNNTNTAGGYFDFAPVTYNPYLGGTCTDINGNPVQQPLPLPGLASFGVHDVVLWNGTSPQMPPNGSCGAPLPIEEDYGLNTNAYMFARGGLATDNGKYNAINTIYLSGGIPAGGATVGALFAGTLYPGGTVTSAGTLSMATYLGGYAYVGNSTGDPAAGTISTTTNPLIAGSGLKAGIIYYNTSDDCLKVSSNALTFACIAGGGGGSGTVTSSAQFNIPYYTTNPTGTVVGGSSLFTWNPATPQVTLAGNFQTTGTTFGFNASTCTATNCVQAPLGGVTGKSIITTDSAFWIEEAAPILSIMGQCRTYADSAAHNLLLSCNAGPYAAIGGTGSGTVASGTQFQIGFYAATGTTVSGNSIFQFNPTGTPQVSLAGNYQTNGTAFGFNASTCTATNCIQAPVGGLEGKWSTVTDSTFWIEESVPALSIMGQCKIYDDSTSHTLLLSCNAGPFTSIGGGGGSGTVNTGSATQVAIYASTGNVVSGNANFVFNPATNILGVSGSFQANGASAGYNAPIAAAYNAFQAPAGGMGALSFTASNYIQTGSGSSTPPLSSGDSFHAGALYYNTVAACLEVHNGISFSCLSGGGGGVSSITIGASTLTGALTFAGTTNQIVITPAGSTATFALASVIATSGYNATAGGASITYQNSSGNFQVNGNGVMSLAGSITTQGGLNVTTTNASTSIQTLGGENLCNAGTCASGIALQVNGFNHLTLSGGVLSSIINGTFNSTGSGITFQNSSGNYQVNSSGAMSLSGVITTAGGLNVTTTTSGSSIQSLGGANLCNAGTCSGGSALTIDGVPVITVSGGVASMVIAGTGTFSSAVTFNGGFTQNVATNSSVHIGSGNFYTRPAGGVSTAISCSGIADGWQSVTTDNYIVQCIGGARFRAALTSY